MAAPIQLAFSGADLARILRALHEGLRLAERARDAAEGDPEATDLQRRDAMLRVDDIKRSIATIDAAAAASRED